MNGLVPIAEVRTMAKSVAMSGMFNLKNENQAFTLMLIAQAENIHPIQAIQKYSIINGMPSLKATEIQARFQKSGGSLSWKTNTNKEAVCKLEHPSYNGVYESVFTMEDAKLMKLDAKDNWKKMPKQMLMARCISMGVRAVYPDCLNNMYSEDEARDIEPPQQTEEQTEVKVEVNDVDADKKQLAMQLKKLGLNNADMKEFFNTYITSDEILNKVVNNKDELLKLVEQFEENEIIIEEEK